MKQMRMKPSKEAMQLARSFLMLEPKRHRASDLKTLAELFEGQYDRGWKDALDEITLESKRSIWSRFKTPEKTVLGCVAAVRETAEFLADKGRS